MEQIEGKRTGRSEINEIHSSEIQCSPDIQNILQLFLVVCSSTFASPVFLLTTGKDEEEGEGEEKGPKTLSRRQ